MSLTDTLDLPLAEDPPAAASMAAGPAAENPLTLALTDFIDRFGTGLLDQVQRSLPPVYDGVPDPRRSAVLAALKRQPFSAQADVVQAVSRLLVDRQEPAAIINAEMGSGKSMMAIATAAVLHAEGYRRCLVLSPPHLVYKWRREIQETVPGARVWILNGPDTLRKLLQIRALQDPPAVPEFFVLGRVRMRMGFYWRPSFLVRQRLVKGELGEPQRFTQAMCPSCFYPLVDSENFPLSPARAEQLLDDTRQFCPQCANPLWTLFSKRSTVPRRQQVVEALAQLPTIGSKTAERLLSRFGEGLLGSMLEDNLFELINLVDERGQMVFTDRQAQRMERALATTEISFGQGDYQPTEFIKRQLPQGFFGLLVIDEGHEYKADGSAQGQAMGVLARKCRKSLLLTGTLMGGYADDLFVRREVA